MATLAPMSTPARRPFGILSDPKIRSIQSMKNRQNAITPKSAPIKRRALSPELGSDNENVDPNILSLHKRKRSALDQDVSCSKSNLGGLPPTSCMSSVYQRFDLPTAVTPRLENLFKPSAPLSAPAAGRSPTRKRSGLAPTRKRFNPPSFSLTRESPASTISAALEGTKKARRESRTNQHIRGNSRALEERQPRSWSFDIFEEPQEVQEYRMNEWIMTQSADGLGISDDDSRRITDSADKLDRGKENVDPNGPSGPVTRAMAAATRTKADQASSKPQDMATMLDTESRAPLGDLDPAEFYAAGLDATSVVLVHDSADTDTVPAEQAEQDEKASPEFITQVSSALTVKAIETLAAPSLHEILRAATPTMNGGVVQPVKPAPDVVAASTDIEIWESQSAKDENESIEAGLDPASPAGSVDEVNIFACQDM